jgi:hypothetical protein
MREIPSLTRPTPRSTKLDLSKKGCTTSRHPTIALICRRRRCSRFAVDLLLYHRATYFAMVSKRVISPSLRFDAARPIVAATCFHPRAGGAMGLATVTSS